MTLGDLLDAVLLAAGAGWVGMGGLLYWNYRGSPCLRSSDPVPLLPNPPRVSVIVAARNEEDALANALDSFLQMDYPSCEVILVDDDSTDRTGAIADEWAAKPEAAGRLIVIHNHDLPAGWRGKVHALHLAEQAATGEWILATDGDVVFHPSVLRHAMALARRQQLRLLSLAPEFEMTSFAERVVLPAFSLLLATLFPPRLVNDPASPRALAAGAFILMRRTELERLGGYACLRHTLIEDLKTAELFKRHGLRIGLAVTSGLLRTRMYRGWREMFEGLSRTAFEGTGYSLFKVLGGLVIGNGAAVLPWATAFWLLLHAAAGGHLSFHSATVLSAFAACAACTLTYSLFIRYFRLGFGYVFLMPVAALFYSCVAVHSALTTLWGSGVAWKGRIYRKPHSVIPRHCSRRQDP